MKNQFVGRLGAILQSIWTKRPDRKTKTGAKILDLFSIVAASLFWVVLISVMILQLYHFELADSETVIYLLFWLIVGALLGSSVNYMISNFSFRDDVVFQLVVLTLDIILLFQIPSTPPIKPTVVNQDQYGSMFLILLTIFHMGILRVAFIPIRMFLKERKEKNHRSDESYSVE